MRKLSFISAFVFCYLFFLNSPPLQRSNTLALEAPEQAQNAQNTKTEADRLFQQGKEQLNSGEQQKALETYQRVLEIRRKIGDRAGEGEVLHKIGVVYHRLSQYHQAVEFYQKALEIRRNLSDRTGEAATLHYLGEVYRLLGQYQPAQEVLQQALAIREEFNDKKGAGSTLNHLGAVYHQMGDYYRALEYYQKSLTIRREVRDRAGEGRTLANLGIIYGNLGQYVRALEFYQEALAIFESLDAPTDKAYLLDRTGSIYSELGQYSQALNLYEQALAAYKQTNDRVGLGTTLHNIGSVYVEMGQYSEALKFYQQALIVTEEIGDITGVGNTLNNLGLVYQRLGQYSQAIYFVDRALSIFQKLGNRKDVGETLDSLGTVYQSYGQYYQALQLYQQSLAIRKELGDRPGERITLSNIADVLSKNNQPELAIIFYKESVNVTESIRSELRSLPAEQQRSYTTTVADTYRHLADLLLQQDRVLEAQQVLDLLKIQEIEDYLHSVRGNQQTAQGIPLTTQEQQIRNRYYNEILNREIQIGRKLAELEKISTANRTPQQQQEIADLRQMQQEIRGTFNAFINSPEIVAIVQQLSPNAKVQTVDLAQLNTLRRDLLQRLEKKAVLIQPLILADRLELVITTAESPPFRRTVAVTKQELDRAILEFRMALEDPKYDATIPAKKLYDILIKPLEHDLTEAQAKSIIYAPDGQLRYIPLAALYDGKQWLGQRFAINNITATSLTKFTGETAAKPRILAGAFATGRYNFERGSTRFAFSGLQFAGLEVENLVAMVPGTTKLIDGEFNRAMIPRLPDYTIIHLATHAMFVTGQPEDSFILLGDGDTITMPDIQTLNLLNVDLVVLSACQTGIGGKLGNGEEILGFGYQIQETGAKAAIASLWKVDDGGTQALMTAFYTALLSGTTTKAEALQKTQIALITGDDSVLGRSANLSILARTRSNLKPSVASRLSHPYYWASFILIGNGL